MKFRPFDTILAGDQLKLKWRKHPQDYLLIEQAPDERVPYHWAEFPIGNLFAGKFHPEVLKMESLVVDAGLTSDMIYEVAVTAMKSAISRAITQTTLDELTIRSLRQLPIVRLLKPCDCRKKW